MSITIDILKSIDRVLEMRSREEHVDKISVLKQMLWNGVESYLVSQKLRRHTQPQQSCGA